MRPMDTSVNLSTMPLIAGADMLVNGMYNAHMRGNEANLMRQNMQAVKGPMNYNGSEMLNYAQGGAVDNYITHPSQAKQMIEKGEYVQFPNGDGGVAPGWKHDDPSGPGGTPTDLPGNSKVLSDQDKPDMNFVKELTSGRIKKKPTYAEIGAKYDVTKYQKVLDNSKSDPIAKNTANLNMAYSNDIIDQAFAHQEMMKDPGSVMPGMAKGGYISKYGRGGNTNNTPLSPDDVAYFDRLRAQNPAMFNQDYGQGRAGANLSGDGSAALWGPGYRNVKEHASQYDTPGMRFDQNPLPSDPPAYMSQATAPYIVPQSEESPTPNTPTPTTPTYVAEGKDVNVIGRKLNKDSFSVGQGAVPGFLPGAVAAINALNQYPIPSQKYQPDYLGHMEGLNIDPALNRNLAMTKGVMNASSGNASVDHARALQALGQMQNADNEQYGNKFNHDAQQEFSRRASNVQTKNQADLYNIQQMQNQWGKMTQREANKEGAIQQIANNAYTNSRQALMDKNSQDLAGEFFSNYNYKQGQGFKFNPNDTTSIINPGSGTNNSSGAGGDRTFTDGQGRKFRLLKGPDGKKVRDYFDE